MGGLLDRIFLDVRHDNLTEVADDPFEEQRDIRLRQDGPAPSRRDMVSRPRNDKDRTSAHAKEEVAQTQSVAAKIVIHRRKVEAKRLRMIERNKFQAEVSTLMRDIVADLPAVLGKQIANRLMVDLGDVQALALKVTK